MNVLLDISSILTFIAKKLKVYSHIEPDNFELTAADLVRMKTV